MRGLKISEEMAQWVFTRHPYAQGDNTNYLIAFIDEVCESRGQEKMPDHIREIMQQYKPETVMRKRREFCESTDEQYVKEEEMRHDYSPVSP